MTMTIEQIIPWLISCLSVAVAVHFGSISRKRADKEDIEDDTMTLATINAKLDNIGQSVDEIKYDNRSMQTELKEFRERLAKVEASAAQAHKRVDTLENHPHLS